MSNPLREIMQQGQSIWFDNVQRAMLSKGELAKMVEEDDLRGVTSNPTIFEKAITGSEDYADQMQQLVSGGADVVALYEGLVVDDIEKGADVLKRVYDATDGLDGYISLEVNPRLAYQTQETIDEATRLFEQLGRKNIMIKIPASQEGLPAIEESIYRGININVTMIFSVENYAEVAEAYIKGLERRAAEGKPVDHIGSVASFFLSRIDTMIDKQLEDKEKATTDEAEKKKLEKLMGRAAIANAKIAYAKFKEIFHGERFAALKAKGAMVQRPLWASTGTKNPKYSDVLYVDSLVGPETVNTVPPATYKAIRDHGKSEPTLDTGLDDAKQLIDDLREAGIDLHEVTTQLQKDGLAAFVKSFDTLEEALTTKRTSLLSTADERLKMSLGKNEDAVAAAVEDAGATGVFSAIWEQKATLWKSDEAHTKIINNALGWLPVAKSMHDKAKELNEFADEIRQSGDFTHAMVCGMGGSSLCPEVLRQTFGKREGYPELLVLDSTDPDALALIADQIEPTKCLFIIASKSGTTTEPLVFYKYWYDRVGQLKDNPGENFIAITDPGTLMEQMATEDKFRRIFVNPADIGGRYSALSYFGMVPAALMGVKVESLLGRAVELAEATTGSVEVTKNPGARLGAVIGECAKAGRDKLTIVADPKIASFGLWVEQLIAESTGKEGKGVIPVAGEPLGSPEVYGDDRVFVSISVGKVTGDTAKQLEALADAGNPVVYRTLRDLYDLGEEFFLWEVATAFAGKLLEINPFDQPNVQESKDATKELLEAFTKDGELQQQSMLVSDGGLTIYTDTETLSKLSNASTGEAVKMHLARVKAGDYIAFLDYVEETPAIEAEIQAMRLFLRDATKCATTTGYGPRFLHSTGQLHKGGPDSGVFFQLTAPDAQDFNIPNQPYTFSVLKQAQAIGDFRSLSSRGRRAIRVDLGTDLLAGLKRLRELIEASFESNASESSASQAR